MINSKIFTMDKHLVILFYCSVWFCGSLVLFMLLVFYQMKCPIKDIVFVILTAQLLPSLTMAVVQPLLFVFL